MELMTAVVTRINELRQRNQMSLWRLSKISQIPTSTIKDLVGQRYDDVKISKIYKIAGANDITLRDFFDSDLFDSILE